ncbi:dephospho-CoA kinase [Sagittula sp. SSi028]|uniref:dephospho-CoA kinase n=1 Tax=Sagittula sp. SSi028 TaxID=3400636 RepID=UPI003AF6956C
MKYRLGLTGSMGMGKSTTAEMFAAQGCVVWDADATVHALYAQGGAAVAPLGELCPQIVVENAVDRGALRAALASDDTLLAKVEAVVHPLVQASRGAFMADNPDKIGVFDIPLLYETGAEVDMDGVACVNVSRETQISRILARGTMNEADISRILSRQMPNSEKCARADWVIETESFDEAQRQVTAILADIQKVTPHA